MQSFQLCPCSIRRRAAAALLGAALLCAGAPASPQGAAPGASAAAPAVDPALVARAAETFYQSEIARTRRTHTINEERWMLARVRGAGERLIPRAKAAAGPSMPWSWTLSVETRREPVVWTLPNGQIWASTGLVQGLNLTDAEISAILAHSIAHALRGDDLREAAVAYKRLRDDPDPDTNRAALELAAILGKVVTTPHYDAESEQAADALSVELIARSGVDPAAAASAWRKVSQSAFTAPPALRAMHPVTAERLAALQGKAAAAVPLYEEARAAAAAAPKPPPRTMESKPSAPKDTRKSQSPYAYPPPRAKPPSTP